MMCYMLTIFYVINAENYMYVIYLMRWKHILYLQHLLTFLRRVLNCRGVILHFQYVNWKRNVDFKNYQVTK